MDDWVLIIATAGSVGLTFYQYIDRVFKQREWTQLQALLNERLKQHASAYGVPFTPVSAGALNFKSAQHLLGTMRGELSLDAGSRGVCEVIMSADRHVELNVTRTIPRRGRFHDMGFNLTAEGMQLSLEGQLYALSLAQAKLVFKALELEPWPEALKSFTYDSRHIELTLIDALRHNTRPEVIARLDELWAQSSSYFERFLAQDIDHSKAPLLVTALRG
jgi:hypothetical protein